jgi:hypothetical protein
VAQATSKKMTMRVLILLIFLSSFQTANGQVKPYFPNLTHVVIDTSLKVVFGYENKSTRFINIPCYKLDKKDPRHCYKDSVLAEWTVVAKYKSEKLLDSAYIIYSQGMSDDPGFGIYTKEAKCIGYFPCLEFYINASGTVYTAGHTDNMYNHRRKFQIQVDTVLEIKQPYNYVGLKGKTLKDLTLYRDKTGNNVVAQLPKGYEIEILLADASANDFDVKNFLARTDFGLVGWIRLEGFAEPIIEGLYFAGD